MFQNQSYDPNEAPPGPMYGQAPVPQIPQKPSLLKEVLAHIIVRGLILLIIITGVVFVCMGVWSIIAAVGNEAVSFHRYITYLFRRAPYLFRDHRAFGAFVELILIAGFIGWVIHRFKRRR